MAVISVKNKVKSGSLLVGNAAFSPSAFESIATTTLSSNATDFTFSSIPQTYKHLQIRFITRLSQTGTGFNDIVFQVNGTNSGYAWHRLSGDGATATAGAATADNGIYMKAAIPKNGNTSGIFGVGIIDLLDYTSTTKTPTIRFFGGTDANGSGVAYLGSGMRTTAAATTSFTFGFTGWDYLAGTTAALYGIKA